MSPSYFYIDHSVGYGIQNHGILEDFDYGRVGVGWKYGVCLIFTNI